MVRISCWFVLMLSVFLAVSAPELAAESPREAPIPNAVPVAKVATLPEVHIGLPEVLFKDVHKNLLQLAAQPFNDIIQKTVLMDGKLEIVKDYRLLAQQLKAKKIDIAVFHGFEYAWIDKSDLVPLVITMPNCGKVQACLVVNVCSAAKEPKDLEGACIGIPKGSKAHCQMFLDQIREGLAKDCKDRCCPVENKGIPPTPEDILDDVASEGGKYRAALVDVSSLISYQRNKPGLGTCLKVLKESELLPSAVVVCRKGALTEEQIRDVKNALLTCTNRADGKMFVMFWNLKGFGAVTDEYFQLLSNCRKAYPEPKVPSK